MLQRCRTVFLDLPSELRLMVFNHMLQARPRGPSIDFPPRWHPILEKIIFNLFETHPMIKREIAEVAYKTCDVSLTITPHREIGIPSGIEWHRFERVIIIIDHYKEHSGPVRWAGMAEVISRLKEVSPASLRSISILFREEIFEPKSLAAIIWDGKWTEEIRSLQTYRWDPENCAPQHTGCYETYPDFEADGGDDGDSIEESDDSHSWEYDSDVWLFNEESDGNDSDASRRRRMTGPRKIRKHVDVWLRAAGDNYGNPVVIEILDYFIDLPPCKEVEIIPPRGLAERRSLPNHYNPEARIFDQAYTDDLCHALQRWMLGDRDGTKVPAGVGRIYGETRLENMAYQGNLQGDLQGNCDGQCVVWLDKPAWTRSRIKPETSSRSWLEWHYASTRKPDTDQEHSD